MSATEASTSSDGYPQDLRVNFMKMQMSTLINYAEAFNLSTTNDMSHMEIANLVANHFVNMKVDENQVINEFYRKTENFKNNPVQSYSETQAYSVPKRQPKKPKKYTQNEEGAYHYNTRSRTTENSDKDTNKENESAEPITYCICGQQEDENMVECENKDCKHKWFHYKCVGIEDPNTLPKTWYCPECRKALNL